ncbi:MAG: nitronate monooxygenase [Ignavibacteria bacterium]|jgi:enoyl-[acyl-carrier protein] reductase II|nr:nitronate monooxygenase [Ignavibacteria bacterium]MCU7503301.1 nitronate monooxygenase [Ignavibacteria bacterium]MCU7515753.1 nitronate monooxygenase [Ignavibacteria bacterium]
MEIQNRITELFNIRYPIIQAGMVWVSGWRLVSAVSNCGGLGLIGAGSMKPELLREHIKKCRAATSGPFGVNIPLLREDASELIRTVIEEGVKIVFTSAGHPGKFIDELKKSGITVTHVVPSVKFALKAESAGCDAVVGEGVEAGGHDGHDELTTLTLIPQLKGELQIPVMAAGGIVNGKGILAAMALGAEGVQLGTRFAVTEESSAHAEYKKRVCEAKDNDTVLILKKIGLVRTLKNQYTDQVQSAEASGAGAGELKELLGRKRERLGIFEGDRDNGMMEAGQGAGIIKDIPDVRTLFRELIEEYDLACKSLSCLKSSSH